MDQQSFRFLGAYNTIHQHLRRICGTDFGSAFASMVKQASKAHPDIRHYKDELLELNELRNAIVHFYHPEEPIATPCEKVVRRIEAIEKILSSPPSIGTRFNRQVLTCDPNNSVGETVTKMVNSGFSQIPVYEGGCLIALLTTDTIARWLGASLIRDGGVLDETSVGDVLQHAETSNNFSLLDPGDTIFDAVECFLTRQRTGERCDAIVITKAASKKCAPTGIITAFDLPIIYEAMK